jgi:hypothetical protein
MPVSPTFTCAVCQQTFPQTDASLQAAEAEAATLWGVQGASHKAHMAAVCEACYTRRIPSDIADAHPHARGRASHAGGRARPAAPAGAWATGGGV